MEPLVTVELQLRSDLLFSLCHTDCICNQLHCLPRTRFICHDAFIIKITDHRQVQHTLAGLDVGDVCYPLLVGPFCMKVPIQQIRVAVQVINSPAVSLSAADLCTGPRL